MVRLNMGVTTLIHESPASPRPPHSGVRLERATPEEEVEHRARGAQPPPGDSNPADSAGVRHQAVPLRGQVLTSVSPPQQPQRSPVAAIG